MTKHLKPLIDNIKLKRKMTFVWLVSVAAVLAFAIWGNFHIIQTYNDTLYSVMVDSMKYALADISSQLENYEALGETLFRNSQIQGNLSEIKTTGRVYSANYEEIEHQIVVEKSRYDYINYVVLIDETTGTVFGGTTGITLNPEKMEKIYEVTEEHRGKSAWITAYGKESQMILTRKITRIENLGKDTLATLIINIDIDSLIDDTGISRQNHFQGILVDEEGNALSDSGILSNEQIVDIYHQAENERFVIAQMEGQQYFAVYQEEKAQSWGYLYLTDYDEIFSEINLHLKRVILVGVGCLLFILILNSFFTRDILQSFDGLIRSFQAFAKDLSNPPPGQSPERKDEIGTLYRQFDQMQEKVVELIRENYVIELERKRAQVEMLETQINPHFLYNTLQTIDWRAKALHSVEISRMVEALSQILQVTLSNKKPFLTVEEELDLVEQFVTIQKMRMEGELIYEVETDQELLDAQIPKLIIQPLVENGIHHSMNSMLSVNRVLVEVRRQGDEVAVYVKNNGSHFPENLLWKLNHREIQPTGHGIGITNIDTRMKLTYGEAYGIDFYNEEDYAVARLLFPFEVEEGRDVSINDRR